MKTTTTTHLHMPRARAWFELSTPVAATICVFLLLLIGLIVGRIRSMPSAAAVPTPALPAPILIIATRELEPPRPTAVPVAQIAAVVPENVTQRAIGVFGAPDTASYIGSVEAGRSFTALSKYGSEWVQVDMSGGTGIVYVRTTDLYGVPELADLRPTDSPQVVYQVVNQPVYVKQAVPTMSEPQPTMQLQQAAIYDRQAWAQQAQAARAQP